MKTNKTISKLVLALTVISFVISSCSTSNHSASSNTRGLNWVKANTKKTTGEKKVVVLNENKRENVKSESEMSPISVKQTGLTASNTAPAIKPLNSVASKKVVSTKGDVSISRTSSTVNSSNELTVVKKEIKEQAKANKIAASKKRGGSGKSQLIALILCFFLGGLGIHRFYLGYIGIGVLELLTGGLCGILTLIDFIRIIIGSLQPKDGSYSQTL